MYIFRGYMKILKSIKIHFKKSHSFENEYKTWCKLLCQVFIYTFICKIHWGKNYVKGTCIEENEKPHKTATVVDKYKIIIIPSEEQSLRMLFWSLSHKTRIYLKCMFLMKSNNDDIHK